MNYRDLSPEAEAALVPDWADVHFGPEGGAFWSAFDGQIMLKIEFPTGPGQPRLRILKGWVLASDGAASLGEVLQFFAANGRLPRRLGDEGVGE